MTFCTKCGKQLDANERFCTACGEPVEQEPPKTKAQMHWCGKCGTYLGTGSRCPNCDKATVTTGGAAAAKSHLSEMVLRNLVMAAVFVVLLGIVFWWLSTEKRCGNCKKTFHGAAYYDSFDRHFIMCEDCAREYYYPFDYHPYKQ